jgi:hypothetical protein
VTPAFRGGTASIEVFANDAARGCLKTQNLEDVVPQFSFPGSAWECMTWRLRLHYRLECQMVTGQSPEDMGSQAEPGNQEPRLLPKI